jgi:hypothetical protein
MLTITWTLSAVMEGPGGAGTIIGLRMVFAAASLVTRKREKDGERADSRIEEDHDGRSAR